MGSVDWLREHEFIAAWLALVLAIVSCKQIFSKIDVLRAYGYFLLFGATVVMLIPAIHPAIRIAAAFPAGYLFGFMVVFFKK